MIYVTLDTCVWLKLLYIDFKNEDNFFEEICFWIENKHIIHIVPTNIIDEWNRHKIGYQNDIVSYFKKKEQESINFMKHNTEFASTYNSEEIQKSVQLRIERIDKIISSLSEKAPFNDDILKEAGHRNLQTLAPNHRGDSFRDTVNILSLIHYLKSKGYKNSIFTTDNYKDFCIDSCKRYELHDGLKREFSSVNLTYMYIGENDNFGIKLFSILRQELAANSFQVFLKNKKAKEEEESLLIKKSISTSTISNPDADFLENIKYIDIILAKKVPTTFEQEVIKSLIGKHSSYKQYFLNNIGNNGLV